MSQFGYRRRLVLTVPIPFVAKELIKRPKMTVDRANLRIGIVGYWSV